MQNYHNYSFVVVFAYCRLCTESVQVFLAWREATTRAVSKRLQQGEAVDKALKSMKQGNNLNPYDHFNTYFMLADQVFMCMSLVCILVVFYISYTYMLIGSKC